MPDWHVGVRRLAALRPPRFINARATILRSKPAHTALRNTAASIDSVSTCFASSALILSPNSA